MGRWGCKSAACPKAGVGCLVAMQLHGNLTGVGRGCLALNLWKLVWNLTGNSLPGTDLEILPGSNILGTDLGNPFPRDSPLQGNLSEEYDMMVLDFPPQNGFPFPFFIWESPVGNLFGLKKHFGSSDIFSFGNRGTSTPPLSAHLMWKIPKTSGFWTNCHRSSPSISVQQGIWQESGSKGNPAQMAAILSKTCWIQLSYHYWWSAVLYSSDQRYRVQKNCYPLQCNGTDGQIVWLKYPASIPIIATSYASYAI